MSAPPILHMASLSVLQMRALVRALQVATLSQTTFDPTTRVLWEQLHVKFKDMVPKCEALDALREKERAAIPAHRRIHFCITENCTAPVRAAGEHCLDCQDPQGAA